MLKSQGKSNVSFLRPPPIIGKELAMRLIGNAWITFISNTLTTTDGLGQQNIAEELARLEEAGEVNSLRSQWHDEIRGLLSDLLICPPKALSIKCQQTDIKLLAMALDSVQNTTFKFVEFGRIDREAPVYALEPLIDMFHEKLLE